MKDEKLLGPVDLSPWLPSPDGFVATPNGPWHVDDGARRIDWVIVGGESGRRARPMHPDWATSLRDQCVAAGVPFFFKQWGEWTPRSPMYPLRGGREVPRDVVGDPDDDGVVVYRIGKKRAGRQLEGREWNEFPATPGVMVRRAETQRES